MLTQNAMYLSDLDKVIKGQKDWSALDGRSFFDNWRIRHDWHFFD